MKVFRSFLILSLIFSIAFPNNAISQWHWQNPLPQGNSLLNLYFINQDTGYFVGTSGTIVKTTNAGESWILQKSNTRQNLTSVHFCSDQVGYICGGYKYSGDSSSTILKTLNGGDSWDIVHEDTLGENRSVFCISPDTAFVAGMNGKLLKTTDGGLTWEKLNTGTTESLEDVIFPSSSIGYFYAGDKILKKSTDGGQSWTNLDPGLSINDAIFSISFPTTLIGYVLIYRNGPGKVIKTNDGGISWEFSTHTSGTPVSMDCNSAYYGYLTSYGNNYRMIDGSWWESLPSFPGEKIDIASNSHIFSTLGREELYQKIAKIYLSTDAGDSWQTKSSSSTVGFVKNIEFVDAFTGYASSYYPYDPDRILRSVDGSSWETVYHADTNVHDIQVLDEETIYFCGSQEDDLYAEKGYFGYSSSGGSNWEIIDFGTSFKPTNMCFTDYSTGYLLSQKKLYKTTDLGANWEEILTESNKTLYQIYFPSQTTGYLLRKNYSPPYAMVSKTVDSGISWDTIGFFSDQRAESAYFLNDQKGYVLNRDNHNSYVHFTQDGGLSWQSDTIFGHELLSIHFIDDSTGWLVGYKGDILNTSNGGKSWHIGSTITDNSLYDVFFIDNYTGYVSGSNGSIIKYDTLGGTQHTEINEMPNSLLNIYPNPCTSETNVIYSLEETASVILRVFNIHGQETGVLLNEIQTEGKHKYRLNTQSLPPGIYIVQLRVNNQSHVRKLIIN